MTKTKVSLTVLTLFTLSGCSSFDMSMLNPFSSDEENQTTNMPEEKVEVTEQQLTAMYQEWQDIKPELMGLMNIDSEIASLKSQLQQQTETLASIQLQQEKMSNEMVPASPKTMQSDIKMAPSGTYSLQIAAASTKKAAEQAWVYQSKKYPRFLKHYEPFYSRLTSKNKEFYRVTIGEFSTKSIAQRNCNSFQSVGGKCIVRAN